MTHNPQAQRKAKNNLLSAEELTLKRIALLSFKAWELELHLKINPADTKAKENLKKYKIMQEELKAKYFLNI